METSKFRLRDMANDFSNSIWVLVMEWNWFEKDSIGKQMTRSADSIGANLSEGDGRNSSPEKKKFAYYARGSLYETQNWLELAKKRKLIEDEHAIFLLNQSYEIARQLNSYITHHKSRSPNPKS